MELNAKYMLTVKEASDYYNIGTKALRRIAENGEKKFAVNSGNKLLIIKHRFEEYLDWCCDNGRSVGKVGEDEIKFD